MNHRPLLTTVLLSIAAISPLSPDRLHAWMQLWQRPAARSLGGIARGSARRRDGAAALATSFVPEIDLTRS